MHLTLALLLLLSTAHALADSLTVSYGLYKYELEISDDGLRLTGKGLSLSLLQTKSCKKDPVSEFRQEILHAFKSLTVFKNPQTEKVKVSYQNKTTYLPRKSPQGSYFLGLPDRFKKKKIEKKLLCPKS